MVFPGVFSRSSLLREVLAWAYMRAAGNSKPTNYKPFIWIKMLLIYWRC